MQANEPTWNDVQTIASVTDSIYEEILRLSAYYDFKPVPDSKGMREINKMPILKATYVMGCQQIEFAIEHVMAFRHFISVDGTGNPLFSCARVAIETIAIANWLFDTQISAKVRLTRTLNVAYYYNLQTKKFLNRDYVRELTTSLDLYDPNATTNRYAELKDIAREWAITEKIFQRR